MFSDTLLKLFNKKQTPFYYYDIEVLLNILNIVKSISSKNGYIIHYALKANFNDKILRLISKTGFGADCVSGNEVKKAIATGFSADSIVFSGVGKSDEEINISLDNHISCFNVESIQELEVINDLAFKKNIVAPVALRINPDIASGTHKYITTGKEENKFGVNPNDLEHIISLLLKLNNVQLTGLHFHIGSQITDLNVFKKLCLRINEISDWFNNRNIEIKNINVGGGLGINYEQPDKMIPDFENYFEVFNKYLNISKNQKLHFEPGRSIVAHCGTLISRVLYIKKGLNTDFVILDAGLTELIRPALYQSYHKIENISSNESKTIKYNVVGPICESSDYFGKEVELKQSKRGDIIAIRLTGAYGEVMASVYNLRTKAKAYYSDETIKTSL
ncbi:diaminopimelate decarboxylase [Bacteroidota bacterium]